MTKTEKYNTTRNSGAGSKAPGLVAHGQSYNPHSSYFQSLINWTRDCSPPEGKKGEWKNFPV